MKNHPKLVCRISALIVIAVATLVLAGWLFDISVFKNVMPRLVTMKPNTALCFLLSAIALWLWNKDNPPKIIIFVCSFLVLVIGLLTFSEYIFTINFGIDELLFKDHDLLIPGSSNPGRMSPNTALNFIFMGLAFLFLSAKFRVTQILSSLILAIAFFALIGYFYSVSYLTNFSSYDNKMAIHTIINFLLLGTGILFCRPGKGFLSVILSKNSGGTIARPILLFALTVPIFLGWLLLKGQFIGIFRSIQFGVALLIITMIIALIVIIWLTARSLNRAGKEKGKTEKELAVLNAQLETKVAERTNYLDNANKELAFQNKEKEKRAAELVIANKELAFQNEEKEKRAAELIIANKELAFQNNEKEKRAAEVFIANKELAFQNHEKEKRAAELIIANKELAFQNDEKEKRAAELSIANKELAFQNEEKEKRAAELIIANEELAFQNHEKEKRAAELTIANTELAFQNHEKEKRAAELTIANKELAFQNDEKEKRAAELTIANKELIFQNAEKEKTEHELIQSERRLAKAQQLAQMGSWEFDMIHNTNTWSDGMYNIYGIDHKEQPSMELFLSFMHPDDLESSKESVKKAFSTLRDSSFNFRFIKKDGEVQYGYTEYRFELDQNKKPVRLYGIVQDMSEKKKAEDEVVHIENRFRALIEKGSDMKTLLSGDGKLLYGSPSITKVLGYTLEEYAQKSLYDFIHPDDIGSFIENVTLMLQTPGNSFNLQQRMLHKNGNWIWCEGTSTNMLHEPGVNALVSNFRDISEKKIAEQQREFDSNNLNALINSTTDLMWSVDKDFKLITFNKPFFETIRNVSGKQVAKGSDVFSVILSPEQSDRFKISYARAFTGEAFTEIEYIPEPVEFWSEISYYPMRNADEVIGTACHSQNITERKLAELERTKITNDLIQHNKDLEQFAYIVSHNLRAPVANILGASGRLGDPLLSKEKKDMLSRGLNESVRKLDNVIKDLNHILQVKREISETKEKVRFSKMVNDIKISIKNLIDADNIEINYDFSEIDECVTLKSYFYSIFYNLISNSIKYRQPELPGIIKIESHRVKDKIELVFTDNGRGIDLTKKSEQVFGLYKRFHTNTEGKGMGLFMVKTQVETLGGKISIKSEVNKGTEFKIEI